MNLCFAYAKKLFSVQEQNRGGGGTELFAAFERLILCLCDEIFLPCLCFLLIVYIFLRCVNRLFDEEFAQFFLSDIAYLGQIVTARLFAIKSELQHSIYFLSVCFFKLWSS